MPYIKLGDLTHGSRFKASPDGHREWRVRRHAEDYTFATPLDLSTAEKISRDDADDMLNGASAVWVDECDRNVSWIEAKDVGAYSIAPPLHRERGVT